MAHPGYDPATSANDIAILVLNSNSTRKSVPLAPANLTLVAYDRVERGWDTLLVAGWGLTETGTDPEHLR